MSPKNVSGKIICARTITGIKIKANLHAEKIRNITLIIFDSTLFVIMYNFIKIIETLAINTANATPIMSHLKPTKRQQTVSTNSNNRIKNWYLTNAKLLKKQSHKRPSMLNTKANERIVNTGNKIYHSYHALYFFLYFFQ